MARLRFDLDGIPLDDEEGRTTAILRFRTTAGLVLALPESVDVTVPWGDLAEASVDLVGGRVNRSPGARGAAAVKRFVACAIVACAVLAPESRAWAGPWTREAGHGYIGTAWSRIAATSVFAGDGTTEPIPRYEQNAWGLYGELGLISRWLTATVESTLVRDNAQSDAHTTGIGDWRFGAWSGVVVRPVLGATVTVPLGSPTPRDVQPGRTPLGSGEFSLDVRASFGWAWPGGRRWPLRHYFIVEAGYWRRRS